MQNAASLIRLAALLKPCSLDINLFSGFAECCFFSDTNYITDIILSLLHSYLAMIHKKHAAMLLNRDDDQILSYPVMGKMRCEPDFLTGEVQ